MTFALFSIEPANKQDEAYSEDRGGHGGQVKDASQGFSHRGASEVGGPSRPCATRDLQGTGAQTFRLSSCILLGCNQGSDPITLKRRLCCFT